MDVIGMDTIRTHRLVYSSIHGNKDPLQLSRTGEGMFLLGSNRL